MLQLLLQGEYCLCIVSDSYSFICIDLVIDIETVRHSYSYEYSTEGLMNELREMLS